MLLLWLLFQGLVQLAWPGQPQSRRVHSGYAPVRPGQGRGVAAPHTSPSTCTPLHEVKIIMSVGAISKAQK